MWREGRGRTFDQVGGVRDGSMRVFRVQDSVHMVGLLTIPVQMRWSLLRPSARSPLC